MNYICPVCGYNRLRLPPADHTICPSCGTQFGYDDCTLSHEELRREWLLSGPRWWSRGTPLPEDWDPISQLLATKPVARPGSVTTSVARQGQPGISLTDRHSADRVIKNSSSDVTSYSGNWRTLAVA